MANEITDKLVVIYEPLTDRRQHFTKNLYKDVFNSADEVYWLPSYLAREDPASKIIEPKELISLLNNKNSHSAEKNPQLKNTIDKHLKKGATVLCLAGGGGGSLDEWLRQNYQE